MTLLQAPLIQLGPGGEFVREYATCPDHPARLVLRKVGTRFDRGDRGNRWSSADSSPADGPPDRFSALARLVGVLTACVYRLEGQTAALANTNLECSVIGPHHDRGPALRGPAATWTGSSQPERTAHEPDAKAAPYSPAHPRLARAQGLFPDHARARGRNRGQQGHGLRARRSPHQEASSGPRAEQGSLFVDR